MVSKKRNQIILISIVSIMILTIIAILVWRFNLFMTLFPSTNQQNMSEVKVNSEPIEVGASDFSAWLWDSPDTFSKDQLNKMFQVTQKEKITMIYLRMDDYAYIYGMRDTDSRLSRLTKLNDAAKKFISTAHEYNINVQALGGDSGWADPNERSYPDFFVSGVLNYNSSNPEAQFVGIQFDVESYNSEAYNINKTQTLTNYLDFVQAMVNRKPNDQKFAIGFTVPMTYGRQNDDMNINWQNNGTKLTAYHIFDILNKTTGGYAILMDYRNYAVGQDGSLENSQNDMQYIHQNCPNVKFIIGQETTKVSPSKITFYDTSKQRFKTEVAEIIKAYSG